MKNQLLVGYRVFKKIQVRSSRVRVHVKLYQKALASLAKWSIDTKVWNMSLWQRQIFHGHRFFQHLYHVTSFKSINIVFETGKYHSYPNTLPFRVGYWGANTRTPVSDPSTHSSHSATNQLHVKHFLVQFKLLGLPISLFIAMTVLSMRYLEAYRK